MLHARIPSISEPTESEHYASLLKTRSLEEQERMRRITERKREDAEEVATRLINANLAKTLAEQERTRRVQEENIHDILTDQTRYVVLLACIGCCIDRAALAALRTASW